MHLLFVVFYYKYFEGFQNFGLILTKFVKFLKTSTINLAKDIASFKNSEKIYIEFV